MQHHLSHFQDSSSLHASSYLFQDTAEQMLTKMLLISLLLLGTVWAALKQGKNLIHLMILRAEK